MSYPNVPPSEAAALVRIVIAESNPASADLLRAHLEALGYSVDWAPDGDHALALAASGAYHVMLLDVQMQTFRGVDVIRKLHLAMGRPLRVIAVTKDRMAVRDDLLRMGVDGFLTRPVDLARLDDELKRVLAKPAH